MHLQAQAVEAVQVYYQNFEKEYDGTNLNQRYQATVTKLQTLQNALQDLKVGEDERLKSAVADYLSGFSTAFQTYEISILERLGQGSGFDLEQYKAYQNELSQAAMKFSQHLSTLDRELDVVYHQFFKDHNKELENKSVKD